ncbi:MAG: hypothetical protein KKA67_15895 [Spirochaetes bacterium]|nr:hypothetical protein [Spirochaetota bacterium]MBU1082231.1 hypothetical protein [Spirochaetota bacterium]
MTIRRVSILGLAAAVLLSACATKPPAVPEPEPQIVEPAPEPPKEPEISREDLEALHGRVLALRKDAFELGLKDVMPKEYEAAEARYVPGKAALDADDRPTAKAELGAAEPLFADLVAAGGLKVAQARKSDAASARDRALAADAQSLSAEALATAEAALAKADAALASGDVKAAIDAYALAIAAFDAVAKRSAAVAVKGTVDELDYGPMDSGNYALAGEKLAAVDSLLGTDPKAAQDASEEALLRYRLVLAKGWELTAGGKRQSAERFKIDAEAIKAQVAVKTEYAEAKSAWDTAVAVFASGDHEASAPLFDNAQALFEAVYETAAAKRAAAEKAIRAASAKNEESAAIAGKGDENLGPSDNPEAAASESAED